MTADDIITSLNLVLKNAPTTGDHPTEEMDNADVNELNTMIEFNNGGEDLEVTMPTIADDAVGTVSDEDDFLPDLVEKLKKKKMHEYMLQDPQKIGHDKLKTMDVSFTRVEKACRLEKKSRIQKDILNGIKAMMENVSTIKVGQELNCTNHCEQYTRSRRNNLDLK